MNAQQKKGCLLALGIPLVLVSGFLAFLPIYRHYAKLWPEKLPHVRMEPRRTPLSEEAVTPDNAFYYLRQITNVVHGDYARTNTQSDLIRFSMLRDEGAPYPFLAKNLFSNAANLALWEKAGSLTQSQVATVGSLTDHYHYVSAILHVGKMTGWMAFEKEQRPDDGPRAAADCWLTALQNGQNIMRGGALIHHLIGLAIQQMACDDLRFRLCRPGFPAAEMQRLKEELARFEKDLEPFSEMLRYEHAVNRNAAIMIFDQPESIMELGMGNNGPDDKAKARFMLGLAMLGGSTRTRVLKHLDAVQSQRIDMADRPFESNGFMTIRPTEADFAASGMRSRYMLDDPLGAILLAMLSPSLQKTWARHVTVLSDLRATRIVLALRQYEADHGGRAPATLDELVPSCLPSVPEDPFDRTGAAFRYARRDDGGWMLYSVGPNQVDEAGRYDWTRQTSLSQADLVYPSDEAARRRRALEEEQARSTSPIP